MPFHLILLQKNSGRPLPALPPEHQNRVESRDDYENIDNVISDIKAATSINGIYESLPEETVSRGVLTQDSINDDTDPDRVMDTGENVDAYAYISDCPPTLIDCSITLETDNFTPGNETESITLYQGPYATSLQNSRPNSHNSVDIFETNQGNAQEEAVKIKGVDFVQADDHGQFSILDNNTTRDSDTLEDVSEIKHAYFSSKDSMRITSHLNSEDDERNLALRLSNDRQENNCEYFQHAYFTAADKPAVSSGDNRGTNIDSEIKDFCTERTLEPDCTDLQDSSRQKGRNGSECLDEFGYLILEDQSKGKQNIMSQSLTVERQINYFEQLEHKYFTAEDNTAKNIEDKSVTQGFYHKIEDPRVRITPDIITPDKQETFYLRYPLMKNLDELENLDIMEDQSENTHGVKKAGFERPMIICTSEGSEGGFSTPTMPLDIERNDHGRHEHTYHTAEDNLRTDNGDKTDRFYFAIEDIKKQVISDMNTVPSQESRPPTDPSTNGSDEFGYLILEDNFQPESAFTNTNAEFDVRRKAGQRNSSELFLPVERQHHDYEQLEHAYFTSEDIPGDVNEHEVVTEDFDNKTEESSVGMFSSMHPSVSEKRNSSEYSLPADRQRHHFEQLEHAYFTSRDIPADVNKDKTVAEGFYHKTEQAIVGIISGMDPPISEEVQSSKRLSGTKLLDEFGYLILEDDVMTTWFEETKGNMRDKKYNKNC